MQFFSNSQVGLIKITNVPGALAKFHHTWSCFGFYVNSKELLHLINTMKQRIQILLFFTVLSACSTSRESSSKIESPNPDGQMEQGNYQLEDLDPQTMLFVKDAFKCVEKHQYKKFIYYCNQTIYEAQQSIGIERNQFIYEIFNLSIDGEDYLKVIDATLRSIQSVRTESCRVEHVDPITFYTISGWISLTDGSSHRFTIEMLCRNGEYYFTGGVG